MSEENSSNESGPNTSETGDEHPAVDAPLSAPNPEEATPVANEGQVSSEGPAVTEGTKTPESSSSQTDLLSGTANSPQNLSESSQEAEAEASETSSHNEAAISGGTSTGQSDKHEPAQPSAGGPINLDRIRELRKSQQQTRPQHRPLKSKPAAPPSGEKAGDKKAVPAPPVAKKTVEEGVIKTPEKRPDVAPKVEVPSRRAKLSQDLEDELSAALAGGDLDNLLIGDSMLQVGVGLSEGQRVQGKIMKAQGEHVFVSLGGPNEGVLAAIQFEEPPVIGTQIEVVVRGFLSDEGLYELTVPGSAIEVSDWDDLSEGEVIEVLVTGSNSGGLECKAGSIRGFIPASQVAEYRVEDLSEMVDQKVLCVITEANQRRGNLVLSRRAVLERERQEKRAERLASISVGDAVEGTVTKILDFGAFVDIGGLDGLLHISQLSWDRVQHPSEVLEQGQKVKVRIDKIDEKTGKIGLSYRSLQEHPWTNITTQFPVGSIVKGTVTRIAEFGAFVKISTGVEGLVHLSELAHHRVYKVSNVVDEGQEIEVKILSIDEESQRMSLSIKAVQAAPAQSSEKKDEDAPADEPPAKPALPKHQGPLRGGTNRKTGGEDIGLRL